MADDLPEADEFGAIELGDSDEHGTNDGAEFGVNFEFDTSGIEPGLELDRSGLEPERPEPEPPAPEPHAIGPAAHAATSPSPPPGPTPPAPRPPRPEQPGPTAAPAGPLGNPAVVRALALGAAILVIAVLLVSTLSSDPEPQTISVPEQALVEGAAAFHQGKWIDALKAFKRLDRFPNSTEAQTVRDQEYEAKALAEIMEAKPSSTAIRRLEQLSELYPERVEVRDRLGEVRKALSSGARAAADEEIEE